MSALFNHETLVEHDDRVGVLEVPGPLVLGVDDAVGVGVVGIDGAGQVDGGGQKLVVAAGAVRRCTTKSVPSAP